MITKLLFTTVIIQPLAFYKGKEEVFTFSRVENEVYYQMNHIKFSNYGNRTLSEILYPLCQLLFPFPLPGVPEWHGPEKRATTEQQYSRFKMMENTKMTDPNNGKEISIEGLFYRYWSRTGYLVDTKGVDPTIYKSFGSQYEYKNELNDEVNIIDSTSLPLGVDTVFDEGKFYSQPQFIDFVSYCEKIERETATIFLIKSYQHGFLCRLVMQQPVSTSKDYVEILDETEISEAKELLRKFIEYKTDNLPTLVNEEISIWLS